MYLYYRALEGDEGWVGESYLMIWRRSEVMTYSETIFLPPKYHFFGSDGGGSMFGFFAVAGRMHYVCAPNIGTEDDMTVLGPWDVFVDRLERGDTI